MRFNVVLFSICVFLTLIFCGYTGGCATTSNNVSKNTMSHKTTENYDDSIEGFVPTQVPSTNIQTHDSADKIQINTAMNKYCQYLLDQDFTNAYDSLSSLSKKNLSIQAFISTKSKDSTEKKILSYSVDTINIMTVDSKTYAIAVISRNELRINFTYPEDTRIDYHLIKENIGWKILRTTELQRKIYKLANNGERDEAIKIIKKVIQMDPIIAPSIDEYIHNSNLMTLPNED